MEEFSISCPYCGEIIDVLIDSSAGDQEYLEDCSVCCHPIIFEISIDGFTDIKLVVKRDNE